VSIRKGSYSYFLDMGNGTSRGHGRRCDERGEQTYLASETHMFRSRNYLSVPVDTEEAAHEAKKKRKQSRQILIADRPYNVLARPTRQSTHRGSEHDIRQALSAIWKYRILFTIGYQLALIKGDQAAID